MKIIILGFKSRVDVQMLLVVKAKILLLIQ